MCWVIDRYSFWFNQIPTVDLWFSYCQTHLFDFPIIWLWACLTNVIPKTHRDHYLQYLYFYYSFFHRVPCKSMSYAGGHIRTFIQFVSASAPLNLFPTLSFFIEILTITTWPLHYRIVYRGVIYTKSSSGTQKYIELWMHQNQAGDSARVQSKGTKTIYINSIRIINVVACILVFLIYFFVFYSFAVLVIGNTLIKLNYLITFYYCILIAKCVLIMSWRSSYIGILCTSCEVRVSAFYFTVALFCFALIFRISWLCSALYL